MTMLSAWNIAIPAETYPSSHRHFCTCSTKVLIELYINRAPSQIKQMNKLCSAPFGHKGTRVIVHQHSQEAEINPPISGSAEAICFFQRHLVFQGDCTDLLARCNVCPLECTHPQVCVLTNWGHGNPSRYAFVFQRYMFTAKLTFSDASETPRVSVSVFFSTLAHKTQLRLWNEQHSRSFHLCEPWCSLSRWGTVNQDWSFSYLWFFFSILFFFFLFFFNL